MSHIDNIVETIRSGGAVESSQVALLASAPVSAQPTIENWQMNFNENTLSESCQVTSAEPIIGAGLLAYSADGKTFYFGTYCSMYDSNNRSTDTVALPSASSALFNPEVNGHTVMGVVYGEILGENGKLVPFSQQKNFTV
jgi:hypothetical protein